MKLGSGIPLGWGWPVPILTIVSIWELDLSLFKHLLDGIVATHIAVYMRFRHSWWADNNVLKECWSGGSCASSLPDLTVEAGIFGG